MGFNTKGYQYQYFIFEKKLCRIDYMTPTQVEILQNDGSWKFDDDVSFKRFQVIGGSKEFKFEQISEEKAKSIYNQTTGKSL